MKGLGLGLGMGTQRRRPAAVANDAVTTAWIAAVVGNGGTVSGAIATAVNNCIVALKTKATLWAKINNGSSRFSLCTGDQLAAALVPILKGGGALFDLATGMSGGDYTVAGGLKGNGSTKTVDLSIKPSQAGQTGANGCVLMGYTASDVQSIAMHFSDEANLEEMYTQNGTGHMVHLWAGTQFECTTNSQYLKGIFGTTVIANAMQPYRNGRRRYAPDLTTIAAASVNGIYRALGRAGGSFESTNALACYYIGAGLTAQEQWDFTQIVTTCMTALGRPMIGGSEKTPLCAYGDSMTFGQGSTGNANGYTTQWHTGDNTRMTFNGGITGQTSSQIRARLVADPAISTDVVVIMAGTNDYQGGAGAVTTALSEIATMVAAVQATGNTKWVVCRPCGSWLDVSGSGNYTLLLSLCNGIASAYPSNNLDVRAAIIAANNGGSDLPDVANDVTPTSLRNPGDNPHLNDAGYLVMKNAIKAFTDGKGW